MRVNVWVVTLGVMVALSVCVGAHAAAMAPNYLHGKWALGTSEQACNAADVEYFIFRDNGTFEAGRTGSAEAVGFWQLDGHTVHLHFVSSPGFYHDVAAELKDMQGQFHYFASQLVHFNVEKDRFEVVGVLGEYTQKGIARRCP